MATTSASHGFNSPSSSDVPAPLAGISPSAQFSPHTVQQEKQIKDTIFYLRRALIPQDEKLGYVYVTKQADTRFCKVGWASDDPAARIKAIEKNCQVVTEGSWRLGPFFGAFRAERLIHCLLKHVNHLRKECPCGCVNREWYQEDYLEVIRQALVVCGWLWRDPCPYNRVALEKKLEPAWELALKRWQSTQSREVPLTWNDFFLFGTSVDVVIDGPRLPKTQSLPSQLLSPEYVKEIVRSLFKELRKKTRRVTRRVETHSPDDSEASDIELDSPTPQSSRLKAKSGETAARDFERLRDETEGTLNKGTRPKRQETWDHWFVAPELITAGKQATLSSPTSISHGHSSPASMHDSQQIANAGTSQEHNSHTTDGEKDSAGETWYHHQATIDISEGCAKPGEEMDVESADLEQPSFASGDEDIVDISERLARMPGAFPADDTESAAFADMQVCLYEEPGLLYVYQGLCFVKNADGTLCCEKLVDYNWKDIHENRYNIPDLRTFLVNENNLVVWVPATPPISDELFSQITSHSGAEVQCSPVASAPTGSGDTQTGSAGPSLSCGDAHRDAPRGSASIEFALKISASTGSASTGSTSTCSAPPVSASSKTSWTGCSSVRPCEGTAVLPFTPPAYRESIDSESQSTYQSITAMFWYSKHSFEELRLADYNEGRRFAKQEVPDSVEEDSDWETPSSMRDDHRPQTQQQETDFVEEGSDWETSSSMSDNDRPQAKQRALEEELRDLSRESNSYDYELQRSKMGYLTREQRLKRQASNLGAVKSLSTDKAPHPTWDDWPDEPSEDDSEDESWPDAHGRETVIEDEENQRERNVNSKSAEKSPEPQQEAHPCSGPCPAFTSPANTPLAAHINPTEHSSVRTFRFPSSPFEITRPSQEFIFKVPPPDPQSPFSSIKRSGNGAPKFNYEVPSVSSPVESEGDHNSELREDILACSDDDTGRREVPKERLKRMKVTENAHTTITPPLNLANLKQHDDQDSSQMIEDVNVPATKKAPQAKLDVEGLQQAQDKTIDKAAGAHTTCTHARTATPNRAVQPDHAPPSDSRANDALARNATGQLALEIEDTAHEWEDEEASGFDADASENIEERHVPVSSAAWGVDGRLGLGEKREGGVFLEQRWKF